MKGRRVHPDENGWLSAELQPGDFGVARPLRMQDGSPLPDWLRDLPAYWVCTAPNGHAGSLANHQVVEHEDGTITVSPSILIRTSEDGGITYRELWHGFLERGIWRTA